MNGGRSAQITDSSTSNTYKTVTKPTEPQVTSTHLLSTSTNACVWLVNGSNGSNGSTGSTGSVRAPTTTLVSASVTWSPITATYYADIVPYLVGVSSITNITTTDISSSPSTMTVGPSGLCKSPFCVFSSHLHPTKPCCPSSLAPPWLSNSVN